MILRIARLYRLHLCERARRRWPHASDAPKGGYPGLGATPEAFFANPHLEVIGWVPGERPAR
jgi:hypothetical protein